MRMWMVPAYVLCNKHLIGEHGELHKHRHVFEKKFSITGRIKPVVQIEPMSMKIRHEELVKEMLSRGFNHNSPYSQPDLEYLPKVEKEAKVDVELSLETLKKRCVICQMVITYYQNRHLKV